MPVVVQLTRPETALRHRSFMKTSSAVFYAGDLKDTPMARCWLDLSEVLGGLQSAENSEPIRKTVNFFIIAWSGRRYDSAAIQESILDVY